MKGRTTTRVCHCLLAAACLAGVGCKDEVAQQYAQLLIEKLQEYHEQLKDQIATERRLYQDLSAVFAVEAERDVYENLRLDRQRKSFFHGELLHSEDFLDEQEYMRQRVLDEFAVTRQFYEREMTIPEKTAAGLRKIELSAQKLKRK